MAFSYGDVLDRSGCTADADISTSYVAAAIERFRPAVWAALKASSPPVARPSEGRPAPGRR